MKMVGQGDVHDGHDLGGMVEEALAWLWAQESLSCYY